MGIETIERAESDQLSGLEELGAAELEAVEGGLLFLAGFAAGVVLGIAIGVALD